MEFSVNILLGCFLSLFAAFVIFRLIFSSSKDGSPQQSTAKASAAKKPDLDLPVFTEDEVAKHDSATDAWLIINRKVYNVTPYVETHPGGVEAILRNAGADSTEGFHGPQHPKPVFDMIGDYLIGKLAD